jgi:hypothetical protein
MRRCFVSFPVCQRTVIPPRQTWGRVASTAGRGWEPLGLGSVRRCLEVLGLCAPLCEARNPGFAREVSDFLNGGG